MDKLLAIGTDAKTVKGQKIGVLTGILYLAPYDISGYQVCPKASEGCKQSCLYTAGRGGFTNVQAGRIRKTKLFFEDRESFMFTLAKNIKALVRKAKRESLTPAVRLNGTSDILWERIGLSFEGIEYSNIMDLFPSVQFYDYTKIPNRDKNQPVNYHLTFSLTEDNLREAFTEAQASPRRNIAVVMDLKPNQPKPLTFRDWPVIDGDTSDVRFYDEVGFHYVALTAKGRAKKDDTGFVIKLADETVSPVFA